MCATVLASRSLNTAEWIALMARTDCDKKSRERYISRFFSNKLISPVSVMSGFIPELMERVGSNGKTVILSLDQSKISDGFECLMISLRVGERAIPVTWRVVETSGAIGFDVQKSLLEETKAMVPDDSSILLAADRFYGTAALVNWCQKQGWQYRIRLKGNLIFQHEKGEITSSQALDMMITALENASLTQAFRPTSAFCTSRITKNHGLWQWIASRQNIKF